MKKKIKLLFIDDDEQFLFMLKQFLEKISPRTYDIKSFNSPNEAFFEIDSNPQAFDVIISDFDMPNLDGLQLFHSLTNSNIPIPFILLTGSKDVDLPGKALNSGIKFFLRKENDIISLLKQLDQIIKITVKQAREDTEIIENIQIMSDFVSLITSSSSSVDNEIYSQLLFRRILESLITISESDYGFINEVKLTDGDYVLSSTFLTILEWTPDHGYSYALYEERNFPFKALRRFYEGVLVEKEPIIQNDLHDIEISTTNELFKLKFTLSSFLALPIIFKENLVGILGLVNKTGKFENSELVKYQPFVLNLANYMYLKMFIENLQERSTIV